MLELLNLIKWMLLDLFRSRRSLEAEVVVLRQQLNVLRRSAPDAALAAQRHLGKRVQTWTNAAAPEIVALES